MSLFVVLDIDEVQLEQSVNMLLRFGSYKLSIDVLSVTPQWGAADAEIKVPPGENTELKRSPLKPRIGQYIGLHFTLTARDFFLAYFYPSGPFTCIFSKTSPNFFLCWLWLTLIPV